MVTPQESFVKAALPTMPMRTVFHEVLLDFLSNPVAQFLFHLVKATVNVYRPFT